MRVMVVVKASKESETGGPPDENILTAMGRFNEELMKAGLLLAGEGLHPTSKGKRVQFSGTTRTVVDGVYEMEDFGAELTPEAREQEERIRKQLGEQK
jgi:hypothetical protein